MPREDYLIAGENTIQLNEITTIPGITNISMYPRLWRESGIAYSELLDRLVQLALDRHAKEARLKTSL
jgi:D-alanine-D-alanine ligase